MFKNFLKGGVKDFLEIYQFFVILNFFKGGTKGFF